MSGRIVAVLLIIIASVKRPLWRRSVVYFNGGSLAFVSPDSYLLRVYSLRFDSNVHYRRLLTAAA